MRQPLNFDWRFIDHFDETFINNNLKDYEIVNIPHSVKEVPYNYFSEKDYQKVSMYEKFFDVYEDVQNKITILRFEGFMLKADIYLNGFNLGRHVSGYVPVEINVSEIIKQKDNRLLVILDSREDKNYPPFGLVVDYLTFSGIYREVNLVTHPKTYLKNIFVHGDMDGNVKIDYEVVGPAITDISYKLEFDNKVVFKSKEKQFKYDNPKLWDLDNPNLYTLKVYLKSNEGEEEYSIRFGFRNKEFRKDGFYLNNKHIKIVGLNRHQGYPIVGYAMPKSMQEDDANILKYEVGVNAVRTSHYPQSEHFLNRCDEIGLLVVNEIPGWQHLMKDEVWRKQVLINTQKMVIEERNHPCIIAHGVRIDESIDDKELYSETNRIAHELDPYTQTIGVRNFKNSELLEDIYGYNDFICNSLKVGLCNPNSVKTKGKPYLVTEYMGHMNPVKPTSDEKQKIETALQHLKVINDNFKNDRIAGAIGWCFVDYHTHQDFGSGDRICAHGVMDLYRNPKYTTSIYASQQDNFPVLDVLCNMHAGDQGEAIFNDIYVVTNCDYIELYNNDKFAVKYEPKKIKPFNNLKHHPILIDDLVGEAFDEEKYSKKDRKKISKILSYCACHGAWHLKPSHLITLGLKMAKYKVKYDDLVELFNKYVATWGGEARTFTFKGYKNGECVVTKELGPVVSFDLRLTPSKLVLENTDTYDALRIRVQHIDNHGEVLSYSSHILKIESEGPIKVLGDKYQTLLGGQLSLYVVSKKEKGRGKIRVQMDDIIKEIEVEVR